MFAWKILGHNHTRKFKEIKIFSPSHIVTDLVVSVHLKIS